MYLKFSPQIFLDFLEITVYTSNNLETVDNCSTLWKKVCDSYVSQALDTDARNAQVAETLPDPSH